MFASYGRLWYRNAFFRLIEENIKKPLHTVTKSNERNRTNEIEQTNERTDERTNERTNEGDHVSTQVKYYNYIDTGWTWRLSRLSSLYHCRFYIVLRGTVSVFHKDSLEDVDLGAEGKPRHVDKSTLGNVLVTLGRRPSRSLSTGVGRLTSLAPGSPLIVISTSLAKDRQGTELANGLCGVLVYTST